MLNVKLDLAFIHWYYFVPSPFLYINRRGLGSLCLFRELTHYPVELPEHLPTLSDCYRGKRSKGGFEGCQCRWALQPPSPSKCGGSAQGTA